MSGVVGASSAVIAERIGQRSRRRYQSSYPGHGKLMLCGTQPRPTAWPTQDITGHAVCCAVGGVTAMLGGGREVIAVIQEHSEGSMTQGVGGKSGGKWLGPGDALKTEVMGWADGLEGRHQETVKTSPCTAGDWIKEQNRGETGKLFPGSLHFRQFLSG